MDTMKTSQFKVQIPVLNERKFVGTTMQVIVPMDFIVNLTIGVEYVANMAMEHIFATK